MTNFKVYSLQKYACYPFSYEYKNLFLLLSLSFLLINCFLVHCFPFHSFICMTISSEVKFIRYRLSIGLSTFVRLQEGPVDLQSLTMWYAVGDSPHWHIFLSQNPHFTIESPNFPIPVRDLFS